MREPSDKSCTISVSGVEYARFQAAAKERGVSLAALVDAACADLPTEPEAVEMLADRCARKYRAPLAPSIIAAIRADRAAGKKLEFIANRYGVAHSTVFRHCQDMR